MSKSAQKCDANLLRQLLHDSLDLQQEERLASHLETCDICRAQLETAAGGNGEWDRISDVLRQEVRLQESRPAALRSTLLPAERSSLHAFPSLRSDLNADDFAVDFLQPSDQPGVLGTLNQIEIHSVIGHGGNGIVLKGLQPELNRLVAVKVMAPQLASSAAARTRFAREAQATAAIVHPSVMPILTVHSQGQLPYLVMPYVDCETLQQRLDREGGLPVVDVLRIGHQVAEGLAAAHAQGLVHRDVKPANILLEKGVDRVMLTDFGLARAVDDGSLTRTGIIAGTPQYMSPEQARGDLVDTRSDLFSLGSVLYAMCTGCPPFRAETTYGILRRVTDEQPGSILSRNPAVPAWLNGFIGQLMQKQSDQRPASADNVADSLRGGLAHLQQPLTRPLPVALQRHRIRRGSRALWACVAGAMLVAAFVFRPHLPGPDPVGPGDAAAPATAGTTTGSAADLSTDSATDSATRSSTDAGAGEQTMGPEHNRNVTQTAAAPSATSTDDTNVSRDSWSTTIDEDLDELTSAADSLLDALQSSDF